MANRNAPNGFTPVKHRNGGEIRVESIQLAAANAAIGIGDALVQTTAGVYDRWTAGTRVDAVAMEAASASDGGTIKAIVDEDVIFEAQTDDGSGTGTIQDAMTLNFTMLGGTPVNGRSIFELDETSAAVTADLPWKCVGLSPRVGNAFGEFNRLLVVMNHTTTRVGMIGI